MIQEIIDKIRLQIPIKSFWFYLDEACSIKIARNIVTIDFQVNPKVWEIIKKEGFQLIDVESNGKCNFPETIYKYYTIIGDTKIFVLFKFESQLALVTGGHLIENLINVSKFITGIPDINEINIKSFKGDSKNSNIIIKLQRNINTIEKILQKGLLFQHTYYNKDTETFTDNYSRDDGIMVIIYYQEDNSAPKYEQIPPKFKVGDYVYHISRGKHDTIGILNSQVLTVKCLYTRQGNKTYREVSYILDIKHEDTLDKNRAFKEELLTDTIIEFKEVMEHKYGHFSFKHQIQRYLDNIGRFI